MALEKRLERKGFFSFNGNRVDDQLLLEIVQLIFNCTGAELVNAVIVLGVKCAS